MGDANTAMPRPPSPRSAEAPRLGGAGAGEPNSCPTDPDPPAHQPAGVSHGPGSLFQPGPWPVPEPEASRYLSVDPQTLGRLRILRIGDVELQLDGHRLLVRGTPVHLPHKEFVILRQLMDNAGRVVTRRELIDNAWGPDRADVRNYLEVHIRRLRTKIESDADRPTRIRTVRSAGYIFDLPQDD